LLDGGERLLVEVDGLRRVVADQVRRRRVVAIGNRLDVARHELLLRSTIPLAARRDSYATRVPAQTSGATRRSDAPRRPPSTDTRPRSSDTASIARHRHQAPWVWAECGARMPRESPRARRSRPRAGRRAGPA